MSPVIRLLDSTYNRLGLHAIGFDAPNNVIERLIDFYESHHKNSQKSNSQLYETTQTSRPVSTPLSGDTKRPLGRKGYKQLPDYLIPVINLIKNGMSHTNAFHQIAKKLNVTYPTVSAQCTKRLNISTEEFVELVKSNKIRSLLKERFPERVVGLLLEASGKKEVKMEDGTQLKKVRELYSKLIETQFSFMGKGEFNLKNIYSTVKKKYSYLCDDSLMCCVYCKSSQDQAPEWQHRVRTVLGALKNKGNVEKGCNRGYWFFCK